MKRIHRITLFRLSVTVALFFACASPSLAAICCSCYPSGNPTTKTCLTSDTASSCTGLTAQAGNTNLTGYTCDTQLDVNTTCKPVSSGGSALCANGPTDATSFNPNASSTAFTPIVPKLNVEIPGLIFSSGLNIVPDANQTQAIQVPYFAQYIAAAYRYLIAISVIAAAVMIVYGGFKYILGSSISSINGGKQTITDAIIGLVLVFSAYTILQVFSPATIAPAVLQLTIVKPDPLNSFMGAAQDAPGVLASIGVSGRSTSVPSSDIATNAGSANAVPGPATVSGNEVLPPPSVSKSPTNLTIPLNCPGRDSGADSATKVMYGGKPAYPKSALAISLTEDQIKQYLQEQARTGIPAGVLIAQIMSETGAVASSKCIVQNMFTDPSKCGSAAYFKYFNFGGVGCTARQVGNGNCPNLALPKSGTSCDDPDGPNNFNQYQASCKTACNQNPSAESYDCGKDCYPQPSTASGVYGGKYQSWKSIQCSRKYANAQDFLNSHLGFASYCLPYNDSVYKFAYCIGASTYATDGNKAAFLAEVIERNCLCGSKDSSGCKRDLGLEERLSKSIIKKANLYNYAKTDTASIIDALTKSTGGALTPTAYIQADNMSRIANPQ